MIDIPIALPPKATDEQILHAIDHAIDQAIVKLELTVTMRDTLKKFPGCVHWHVKNGRESGTLEITYWPDEHRAWFTIQDGRKADWIEVKMKMLKKAIRS